MERCPTTICRNITLYQGFIIFNRPVPTADDPMLQPEPSIKIPELKIPGKPISNSIRHGKRPMLRGREEEQGSWGLTKMNT
jgi:hypothetical protein